MDVDNRAWHFCAGAIGGEDLRDSTAVVVIAGDFYLMHAVVDISWAEEE